MSDDDQRAPGSVRRVTSKNRKEQLNYGSNLFPPESPLSPDPNTDSSEPGEPLPFDEAAFTAQAVERISPLPFDGEEAAPLAAQAADDAERFPPLPPPAWARHEQAEAEPQAAPAPRAARVSQPAPARAKARKPAPKTSRKRGCLYNLLTLIFFLLTVGAVIYGIYLFQNPYSPLNPLPPATSLPIMITATPEPAPALPVLDATPTQENTLPTAEAPVVDAPPATPTELAATATYTPLPPEVLTEMAPTQEQFNGSQSST